jgi:hypothetical protein
MKKLVTLTALTLISVCTPSQARDPLLECTGMPAGTFEVLEVYGAKDGLEVVTKAPGEVQKSSLIPGAELSVEASIPLPALGTQSRYLEWRHTGFYLTSYTGGVSDRTRIDCE